MKRAGVRNPAGCAAAQPRSGLHASRECVQISPARARGDSQRRASASRLRQSVLEQGRIEGRRTQPDEVPRARVDDGVVAEDSAKSRDIAHQRSTSTFRRETVRPRHLFESSDRKYTTRFDEQCPQHASLLRAAEPSDLPITEDLDRTEYMEVDRHTVLPGLDRTLQRLAIQVRQGDHPVRVRAT